MFGSNAVNVPKFDEGRQAQKSSKQLTPQTQPFSNLNHREILQELQTWEHIESKSDDEGEGEDGRKANMNSHLLSKFDRYMKDKED